MHLKTLIYIDKPCNFLIYLLFISAQKNHSKTIIDFRVIPKALTN